MKMISDLPDYVVTEIRRLVSQGRYSSVSAFLLTAAENQLALETLDTEDVIEMKPSSPVHLQTTIKANGSYEFPSSNFPVMEIEKTKEKDNFWETWIWGQINRLLPIKFAARYLAIESAKASEFPDKARFNNVVSDAARNFGRFLQDQDEKLGKARDQKLSTGFPTGENSDKSLSRYWSQFAGYGKSDGTKTGALFELSLANMTEKDGEFRIGLTKEGRSFAQLSNPIIDEQKYDFSLSRAEKEFYLNHILAHVPGEVSLFTLILQLLRDGVDRREDMNTEIAKVTKGSGWSEGLISTQRSGAISRMFELGLISKEKVGLRVRYQLTSQGNALLERVPNITAQSRA